MRRDLYIHMSCFCGLKDIPFEPVDPPYVIPDTDLDRIIRDIFTVDEISGLPKGDISYYLSPDGNPTVKLWLENNLLKPRSVNSDSTLGLDDDIIFEFSRKPDESVFDYSSRLSDLYNKAKEESLRLLDESGLSKSDSVPVSKG